MTKRGKGGQPQFWQFARDWLHDYCTRTRRMSPATVEAYRIGLEGFITILTSTGIDRKTISFDCFSRSSITAYATWMTATKGYQPRTVDLRLTVLKSFLQFAAWQDPELMALHETAATIRAPKAPKKPVEHLAPAAILAAPGGATARARRNRTLLVVLYDSAARVSEITDVTVADLHLTQPAFITLTGKGGKTRNMPLMDKTVAHLRTYLGEFHPDRRKQPNAPLFYSRRGGQQAQLSTDSVAAILKQAAASAAAACPEIPAQVHCHPMRKTRTMDLYTDGVPLPLIMQMLGHESISTTSTFYAFATMKMMTDAIAAANPRPIGEAPTRKERQILDTLYQL